MPERRCLSWREPLGRPECPYCYRWVLNLALFAIRLHKWVGSDDLRAPHDHPYWFFTLVLSGEYLDQTAHSSEPMPAGTLRFRRATHLHRVQLVTPTCWTLVLSGPSLRKWSFWVGGKFVRREAYFRKFGPHPCDPAQ